MKRIEKRGEKEKRTGQGQKKKTEKTSERK